MVENKVTLKELAKEYRQSADKLLEREKELKQEVRKRKLRDDWDFQLRINLLREERYELLKTAAYLDTYYDN